MAKLDDKACVMSLLQQAAKRNLTTQALEVMISTTPRGAAINWLMVRAKLDNFVANMPSDDPVEP